MLLIACIATCGWNNNGDIGYLRGTYIARKTKWYWSRHIVCVYVSHISYSDST